MHEYAQEPLNKKESRFYCMWNNKMGFYLEGFLNLKGFEFFSEMLWFYIEHLKVPIDIQM